jgi:thiosulfate sulfurtransferase
MESFEQLDIHQVKELIEKGNVTIADIRDPGSFQEAHIEKAVSLNDENIQEFLQTADKSQPLLCYCYHGMSSQGAAQYFAQNGFKKVYSMIGGFEAWRTVYPSTQTN